MLVVLETFAIFTMAEGPSRVNGLKCARKVSFDTKTGGYCPTNAFVRGDKTGYCGLGCKDASTRILGNDIVTEYQQRFATMFGTGNHNGIKASRLVMLKHHHDLHVSARNAERSRLNIPTLNYLDTYMDNYTINTSRNATYTVVPSNTVFNPIVPPPLNLDALLGSMQTGTLYEILIATVSLLSHALTY